MPQLNTIDRERAIVHLQAGDTQNANDLGVEVSTSSRIWTRFQATGSTQDQERCGRPRVTSAQQDRRIYHQHHHEPLLPAAKMARNTIGNHNAPVSGQTIRRQLFKQDLCCRQVSNADSTTSTAATAVGTTALELELAKMAERPLYRRKSILHQPSRRTYQSVETAQPKVCCQLRIGAQHMRKP